MSIKPRRVSYDELSDDLALVFDLALARGDLIVEREDGASISARPLTHEKPTRSSEAIAAFLSSAGGWSDVDTDELLRDIYYSREISSRPQSPEQQQTPPQTDTQ